MQGGIPYERNASSRPFNSRRLEADRYEKKLVALGERVDVLATPTADMFISVSPETVLRQYPDITIDEAIQIRDNACENIWESGGQSDLEI